MENFTFHVPTDIRFGKNRLSELPEVLDAFGKNVLLVYGGGSIIRNGLYDRVVEQLKANGNTLVELNGVEPNPRIETVTKGAELCREHGIDVILAVGGGSVIDCSKAIAAGTFVEGDLWENLVAKRRYSGPAVPIITILTLAATGSEMNRGGVISNLKTQQKLSVSGENLLPKVSFLDPVNTFTVGSYQTLAGSADILSHLMENYFNATPGTEVQDSVTEGLMKTVIHYLPIALEHPEDYDARANLLWASTLALNGLTGNGRKGSWSCHAMEHELSAFYDITHGIGLAILTPRWMAHILNETSLLKFARFAREVWGIDEADEERAAKKGMQALYDFFLENGVPMTLPEVGIDSEDDFEKMAQQAVTHSTITETAFVPVQKADVISIYQASAAPSQFI